MTRVPLGWISLILFYLNYAELLWCVDKFFSSNMLSLWLLFLHIFFSPIFLLFSFWDFHHVYFGMLDDLCSFFSFFFFYYCPWNVWTVLVQFQVHNFSFLSAQIYCCPLLSGLVIVVIVLFNFRISIWPHNLYLICFPYLGHYCSMSFVIYTLFIYLNEVL